jgi:hypothetical protein
LDIIGRGEAFPEHRFQVSAQPPAKNTAGLIEKETDVQRSICFLFNPGPTIEAASLIIKKTVPFWRSSIRGVRSALAFSLLTPDARNLSASVQFSCNPSKIKESRLFFQAD